MLAFSPILRVKIVRTPGRGPAAGPGGHRAAGGAERGLLRAPRGALPALRAAGQRLRTGRFPTASSLQTSTRMA